MIITSYDVVDLVGTVAAADVTESAIAAEGASAPLRPVGRQPGDSGFTHRSGTAYQQRAARRRDRSARM